MKSFLKKDKLLVVLALLALLVSLVPIARRVQTEESNKYYDCVLDYASLRAMARQPEMSEDEQYALLATDGMLVKRPLLVGDDFAIPGFREAAWAEALL